MSNNNSESLESSKKKSLSAIVHPLERFFDNSGRSKTPEPSGERRGRSPKSLLGRVMNKFLKNAGRGRTLESSTVTALNNYASATTESHTNTSHSGSNDPDNALSSEDLLTAAVSDQVSESLINTAGIEGKPSSGPNAGSVALENLKLTGRVLSTIVARAKDIVDSNPAKLTLGLVNAIINISRIVKDNNNEVAGQIEKIGDRLKSVEQALHDWKSDSKADNLWLDHFKATLENALGKLKEIGDHSGLRKVLDHENLKQEIADIYERIDNARVEFELALGIRVFKAVYKVDKTVKALYLDRLKPSDIAHHDYILEGKEGRLLRRQVCTPGTRLAILKDIVEWAKDTSEDSPNVYWLFGHAGSGKTTIAYTVARRFEFAGDSDDTIILGGNFFSSRQFDETRLSKYIVRTIVYHLALKCKPFSEALARSGRLESITQNLGTQLDGLLFGPWKESEAARHQDKTTPSQYLIVIDALDEIEGTGGSDFLRSLVDTINKGKGDSYCGLKFFVTSRSDQALVAHVNTLQRKQLYRLQDVKEEDARADVATFLNASFPHFVGRPEMTQLAAQAVGLFIYAATVVKLLEGRQPPDQKRFLNKLLSISSTSPSQVSLQDPEALLNQLYFQILVDTLGSFRKDERECRLLVLFTFLCAKEPLSASSAAKLLFVDDPDETDPAFSCSTIANEVLARLHSVLYVEGGKVLSYHKSFSDFMFDPARSKEFSCDKAAHHRQLTSDCFRVMVTSLRFNIANIPSSFVLDKDNSALADEVERNILPDLRYACRNWDHHLSATIPSTPSDPLHETLSDFLKLPALFWLEAMNLLGVRGHCYSMIQTARRWVMNLKGSALLAQHLAEAAAFAVYFSGSPASATTAHLYISVLATWPRKYEPCMSWKTYFPTIPRFINASLGGTVVLSVDADDYVHTAAFSPDGTHIVSGLWDNSVRVWDSFTGELKHMLVGHDDSVRSVAFSPDGTRIVSGSDDDSVRGWDAVTGEEKFLLKGHTSSVYSVAFSSDGALIVSGSLDKSVRVWDALTGEQKHLLLGHTHWVTTVAISRDGTCIFSGSEDGRVRVWDAHLGVQKFLLEDHTGPVNSVAISNDGTRIVSGSADKSVRIWDRSTGKQERVLEGHTGTVKSVAFSSDGTRIVSGSVDGSIRVWDSSIGLEKFVLEGHTKTVNAVAFSNDGTRIVSASDDESIRVWDAMTSEEHRPSGGHAGGITSVAFSMDGTCVLSGSLDQSVRVWDALTGKEKHMLQVHTGTVISVAFSNEDTIVSGLDNYSVQVWDGLTGKACKEQKLVQSYEDAASSVAFSNNGTYIATVANGISIQVWDVLTGQKKRLLEGHVRPVNAIAFSGDGMCITSGSDDKSVRVWSVLTGKQRHLMKGHTHWVTSVAFANDGTRVASGSDDASVRVWNALTGEQTRLLAGHTKGISSVGFSNDGTRVVSGSSDNSIRVWNTLTGEVQHILMGHISRVNSVAFSNDGRRIVSGSADNSVRIWDVLIGGDKERPVEYPTQFEVNSVVHSKKPRYIREELPKASRLNYSGWLLSPLVQGYLMFVPSSSRLPDDTNILTIPHSYVSHVDFTDSTLGSEWANCFFEA